MAHVSIALLAIALLNAGIVTSLNLYTSDGEIIETTFELAKRSSTIKHLLEDLDIADDDERAVPLPAVNAPIMRIVLEWAELHKDDTEEFVAKANKDKRNSYNIPDADAEFLKKLDQGTLFELIKAANYLDIPELVEITCKTVANMIKGKSPEQIRDTFNIQDRFTADEEEHIRKENKMLN